MKDEDVLADVFTSALDTPGISVSVVRSTRGLEPITPREALDRYFQSRKSKQSIRSNYKSYLNIFVRWCEGRDIDNLNDVSGRVLDDYKTWRRNNSLRGSGPIKEITLRTQLIAVRKFISYCENIDAVESGLHTQVDLPDVDESDEVSDEHTEADEIEAALSNLERLNHPSRASGLNPSEQTRNSRDHAIIGLIDHTTARRSDIHALDVEDYHPSECRVEFIDRPETPLKNGNKSERMNKLSEEMCGILDRWIECYRPKNTNGEGRNPLFTTQYGRISKSTIYDLTHRRTRPCKYKGTCPHDRDMDECEALEDSKKNASKCPSSARPHAIRKGAITRHMAEIAMGRTDMTKEDLSERAGVSERVLEKHYDHRKEIEKMNQRSDRLPF